MALAAGYLLGRQHRTRLAFMLGAAALTRGLSGFTGQLMRSGTKVLGSGDGLTGGLGKAAGDVLGEAAGKAVPGLGEVGDMIRQDLTSVVKRAVATAVSNQIESLSDQLHDRAEAIREQSAGSSEETARARSEDEEEEKDYEDRPAQRRRVPKQRDTGNGRAESRSDEPAEAEDEEPAEVQDEEPAERAPRSGAASRGNAALRSASRAGRSAQASSPIRRTRR
jgi:hypothetical protein